MKLKEAKQFVETGIYKDKCGNFKGALDDFNKAINLDPSFAEAYYRRGCLKYSMLFDEPGGIEDLNKAIELNPEFALAYDYRGNAKEMSKNYVGAIEDLSRAIELDPKISEAYFGRALARKNLGDKKGAIEDLRAAGKLGFDGAYEALESIKKYCIENRTKH